MRHDLNNGGQVSSHDILRLIARYRASGEPLAGFAHKNGIPHGRLHYWIYGRKQNRPGKAVHPPARGPRFEEVRLGTVTSVTSGWAAEVGLPRGLAIRFGTMATPAWIAEIVGALQRSC